MTNGLPPHHEADPLDILQIQRFRIWLGLAPIRRLKGRERDSHGPRACPIGTTCATRHEVIFPADAALLSPVGTLGQGLILECDRVLFGIGSIDVEHKGIEAGQVPSGNVVDGALGSKTRTAEGFDVEVARELGS